MFFAWLRHRATWLALAALTLSTPSFAQESVDWTEDVVLRDGRQLTVHLQGNSIAQPFYLAHQKSKLSQFKLAFEHPDTGATIVWQGARYFDPLLIDFVDKVPYLVVYGRPTQDTTAQYGCPELPYVYLRHGPDGWQPVPVEQAPAVLTVANLSIQGMAAESAGQRLSTQEVANKIERQARESLGLVQKTIPRTMAQWNTTQKRSAAVDRLVGDCRPPRPPMGAVALPAPLESHTSVLESSDYVPEKTYDAPDWNALMTDSQRTVACKPVFQRVELENYHLDLHFTQNPSAQKRVPYARYGVLEPGVQVLCDERVWFVREVPDSNKMTITQTTRAGDLIFHTAFVRPRDEPGLNGGMRMSSLRSEGDYLYFDWMLSRMAGDQRLLKRSLSLRVATSPLTR